MNFELYHDLPLSSETRVTCIDHCSLDDDKGGEGS